VLRLKAPLETIQLQPPNTFEVVSEFLANGKTLMKIPPNRKNKTPQIDLSSKRNLCFITTVLASTNIFKLAWFAISKMSLLTIVNYLSAFSLLSRKLSDSRCVIGRFKLTPVHDRDRTQFVGIRVDKFSVTLMRLFQK
jgi:hypothetical protein